MNEKQVEISRHALGLPNRQNRSYRNYFCAEKGTPEYQEWQDLVDKGLAVKRVMPRECCGDYFYLTLEGAKQVLLPQEHISREDAAAMRRISK